MFYAWRGGSIRAPSTAAPQQVKLERDMPLAFSLHAGLVLPHRNGVTYVKYEKTRGSHCGRGQSPGGRASANIQSATGRGPRNIPAGGAAKYWDESEPSW